jgi:hypothetical protein
MVFTRLYGWMRRNGWNERQVRSPLTGVPDATCLETRIAVDAAGDV